MRLAALLIRGFLSIVFVKAVCVVFLLSVAGPAVLAQAQSLDIVLIDGKSGRPMTGEHSHVNVWFGNARKSAIVVETDKDGVAKIQLSPRADEMNVPQATDGSSIVVDHLVVPYSERFSVNVPYAMCASGGSNYSWLGIMNFSTLEILQHGRTSPNTCGVAAIRPEPGKLVLFVRKLSWWEAFKN